MKAHVILFAILAAFVSASALGQSCTSFPYTAVAGQIQNGSTADASQVMANFNYIGGCAASTANPVFTGSVGIGTSSPASLVDMFSTGQSVLTIGSSGSGSLADVQYNAFNSDGSANNWIVGPNLTANNIYQVGRGTAPSNVALLNVAASGDVGIGTTSPSSLLHVYSPSAASIITIGSSGPGSYATMAFAGTNTNSTANNWLAGTGISANNAYQIANGTTGSNTPIVTVLSSGKFGIGTTSPSNNVDLYSNANSSTTLSIYNPNSGSSASSILYLRDSASGSLTGSGGYLQLAASGNALTLMNQFGDPLYFGTNNATQMSITSSGNVGIGTTSPAQKLEVNGEVKVDTFASATSTGVCQNSGVLSTCSSSIRYKENVKDAPFGLDDVMQMRPVTFKWKGRDETDLGLIAEEVAKINPLFVTYRDGKIEGVKYAQLVAVLAGAIKALKLNSESQAQQVAQLRAKLDALTALGHENVALHERIADQDRRLAAIEAALHMRSASVEGPPAYPSGHRD